MDVFKRHDEEMVMPMGTPWFDLPVTLEMDRTYMCMSNDTGVCELQEGYWVFWYEADRRYGLTTVAFFMTAIILFGLIHLASIFTPRSISRSNFVAQRLIAPFRWLSYRRWRVSVLNWNTAPAGTLLLGAVGIIFFMSLTLGPMPYYWPNWNDATDAIQDAYGSSMPIATRSGWMATGCLPFVILTAGKSNLITLATGVSYDKLQVFHRWISYAMFILALIHTFPFIIFNIRFGTMVESWQTSIFYWTGTVALLAQGWLTFASISPLRNLGYEWFKFSHFVAALLFTLFFFFHCDWILTSAQFFVATLVLFAASWLHRNARLYLEHGVSHRATVSVAANGFIRVVVPTQIRWSVGQHFFVRFAGLGGLHFLGTHPFSACSLPVRAAPDESPESELVFLIRPRGGLTARLAKHAEKHPEGQLRVLLDGPYAGIDMETFSASDRTLVIAGGSGAGWALPFVVAFLRRRQLQPSSQQRSSSLRVILATRDIATQTWFEHTVAQEVSAFTGIDSLNEDDLNIEIFYTGDASLQEKNPAEGQFLSKFDDPEKQPAAVAATNLETISSSGSSTDISISKHVRRVCCSSHRLNRPLLPSIIAEEHEAQLVGSSMSVYLCGPLSMQKDVANAVAARQAHVLQDGGVKALELEVEHFSWA